MRGKAVLWTGGPGGLSSEFFRFFILLPDLTASSFISCTDSLASRVAVRKGAAPEAALLSSGGLTELLVAALGAVYRGCSFLEAALLGDVFFALLGGWLLVSRSRGSSLPFCSHDVFVPCCSPVFFSSRFLFDALEIFFFEVFSRLVLARVWKAAVFARARSTGRCRG